MLDSSFLFMPLGNDLLIVALSAAHPGRVAYYAVMATAGSMAGVSKRAGWALALAALTPPPFPFTPFVAAAAALQYPRRRLLGVIGIARFVRFLTLGLLAIVFGRRILKMAQSPTVQYVIVALVVISLAGSAYSVYTWIRRSGSSTGRRMTGRAA